MARPRKKLTLDKFFEAKSYFQNLLMKEKLYRYPEKDIYTKHQAAQKAFDALLSVESRSELNNDILAAFQTWIDSYALHKWAAFLGAQRQKPFLEKAKMKTLRITKSAHYVLTTYAHHHKITISEAVMRLGVAEVMKISNQDKK